MRRWRGAGSVAVTLLAAVLLTGCAYPVEGRAFAGPEVTAGINPSFVRGSDGGEDDRLAAATLRDLEGYWGPEFPGLSGGRAFTRLRGYYSVDSSSPGPAVPCVDETSEVEGNAFFCPRADIIAYDRTALLPVLRQDFGDASVVVVLAHEFGHAVQERLDASSGGPGEATRVPTILSEGQADCYAGVFLRRVREGTTPDLRTGEAGIDGAMGALVTFRDPVGTGAGDAEAHGNAFDRVSSFQLGFEGSPTTCSGMTLRTRQFSQQEFTSLQDQNNGGNLPLDELVRAMAPDLDRFFGALVTARGRTWTAPALDRGTAACGSSGETGSSGSDAEVQGPTAFCADPRSVRIDTGSELAGVHDRIGDYATGTLLASRYGMAALAALGRPTTGADAGGEALCLAGAYTGDVGSPGSDFGLSPGDLDESVQILLRSDDSARGTDGASGAGTAYERVRLFRTGVTGGPQACLR